MEISSDSAGTLPQQCVYAGGEHNIGVAIQRDRTLISSHLELRRERVMQAPSGHRFVL